MTIEPDAFCSLAAWSLAACARAGLDEARGRAVVLRTIPSEIAGSIAVEGLEPAREPVTFGELGARYERLLAQSHRGQKKRGGSFYTPAALARRLCERALPRRTIRAVLDPSCGAGAILLEASALLDEPFALHGVDIDPVSIWLARVAIALRTGRTSLEDLARWNAQLRVADALDPLAFDPAARFEAIVGNPPWVSYAGRSAAPLDARVRQGFRERFASFSGFPTAQGMFIERAAALLCEGGRLALLVPTPIVDLAGYSATREALTRRCVIDDPLDELGFDQFDAVVQPTVIVSATARIEARASSAPWTVGGREHSDRPALARSLLDRLAALPRFSPTTFGELGFQSAGEIARTHMGRIDRDPRFSVALREGSDVLAYCAREPTLGLDPDPAALARARCSLRAIAQYQRVTVVVRQTARFPIAARHAPAYAFRNSLLACFSDEPDAMCALLNSTLLRAAHLSSQRDGRQAVFPQLKVAHLRALPAPPPGASLDALATLAQRAERAQRDRVEAMARYGPAPKTAFDAKKGGIEPSPAFVRSLRDEQRARFDQALAEVREAYARLLAVSAEIDERVFALYDVRDEERESALAVLA